MKVLLTGASGLIGTQVGIELVRQGHQVVAVSRDALRAAQVLPFPCQVLEADLEKSVPDLRDWKIDAVIHLAGESIGEGRWTKERKAKVISSRVKGTANLIKALQTTTTLKVFIASSAIGFYGDGGDQWQGEDQPAGKGFLSEVTVAWENALLGAQALGARVVIYRTGVVLSETGGALQKMRDPFMIGFGAALGSGRQWMSWVHRKDVVRAFLWALNSESVHGTFNLAAPNPLTNKEWTRNLAQSLQAFQGPPVPEIVLRWVLGEMADLVFTSQRVASEKIQQAGFKFDFLTAEEALHDLHRSLGPGEILFKAEQYLNAAPENVFPFFAEARNLERITPELLNFKIKKVSTNSIQEGTLIDYRLKIHGVPIGWRTRIENWSPPFQFVDTQLRGPYQKWHHTHRFEKLGSGTLMTDEVVYKVPMGLLGRLASGWMVSRDVGKIFDYRRKVCSGLQF